MSRVAVVWVEEEVRVRKGFVVSETLIILFHEMKYSSYIEACTVRSRTVCITVLSWPLLLEIGALRNRRLVYATATGTFLPYFPTEFIHE